MLVHKLSPRAVAVLASTLLLASCGTTAPTATVADGGKSFQTQYYSGTGYWPGSLYQTYDGLWGGCSLSANWGAFAAGPFGALYGYPGLGVLGVPGGCGLGAFGGCGLGAYAGCAAGLPIAADIFGGTEVLTSSGDFDRQPASLPPGIAEENDEAFRPVGSAIWQRK